MTVWLMLEGAGRPGLVVPLDRDASLTLAMAVLGGAAGDDRAEDAQPALAERIARLGPRFEPVASWLRSCRPPAGRGHGDHHGTLQPPLPSAVLGDLAPLVRLESAVALAGEPTLEATVLLRALRTAVMHEQLVGSFARAVAEARLEAMRELAYGAGHEINNPLANIATRAQSLLLDEPDPDRRRRLATIVDQAFRARDMIGGLMLFARPPKPQRGRVDAVAIVTTAIAAIRETADVQGVRLEFAPPPTAVMADVDRVQIEEAVRVVLVNAVESAPKDGRVRIDVRRVTAADGGRCEIVVSDSGRGMTPEALRRAFDPFFSGREAGRGIGLGLPKAWRLVDSSGGAILIDSRPGSGTRVMMQLPEAPTERDVQPP